MIRYFIILYKIMNIKNYFERYGVSFLYVENGVLLNYVGHKRCNPIKQYLGVPCRAKWSETETVTLLRK